MARLKRHNRDKEQQEKIKDGELVTRPDGSQVIKVKKHRRRSKQPSKKTNPKLKWAIIGTASSLALVTCCLHHLYYCQIQRRILQRENRNLDH